MIPINFVQVSFTSRRSDALDIISSSVYILGNSADSNSLYAPCQFSPFRYFCNQEAYWGNHKKSLLLIVSGASLPYNCSNFSIYYITTALYTCDIFKSSTCHTTNIFVSTILFATHQLYWFISNFLSCSMLVVSIKIL